MKYIREVFYSRPYQLIIGFVIGGSMIAYMNSIYFIMGMVVLFAANLICALCGELVQSDDKRLLEHYQKREAGRRVVK